MATKPRSFLLVVSAMLAIALLPATAFAGEGDLAAGSTGLATQAASDHTADDAINWAKSQVGHHVGVDDGSGYYQCVEFIQAYYEYLGVAKQYGNGCDYASNALPAGWTRTAGGTPQKGDILVYGAYGSQTNGHVAIYESDSSLYDQDGSVWGATVKHESANYRTYTWAYWGCIHPNFKDPVDHNPTIYYDSVSSPDGKIRVAGWAYDPDAVSRSIEVHAYVSQNGNLTCIGGTTANVSRKDVDNAMHIGELHGFDATFDVSARGAVDVQVVAINVGEGSPKWSEFKKTTVLEPKKNAVTVPEARYAIRSKLDTSTGLDVTGHSLENAANVQLWKWNNDQESGGTCEKFDIKAAGDGSYYIIATHSDKAVEVTNAYTYGGANVAQYTQNQSVAQRWFFDKNPDGTYTIRHRNSGLVMDVDHLQTANGTNIQQCTYNGGDNQKFYLVPIEASRWNVDPAQTSMAYTGSAIKPKITAAAGGVTMKEGVDYTVSYANNVNAGTATVTVVGKGGFTGSKSATFKITPASLATATVTLSKSAYTYDGKAKAPVATVKLGTKTLKAGTDYTVSYSNNVKAGLATATVAGKGNYAGTAKATFSIAAAPQQGGGSDGPKASGGSGGPAPASSGSSASKAEKSAPTQWKRLSGDIALDTMAAIVDEGFAGTGGTVVVATFDGYWDALAAAGLAGLSGAPVLMTDGAALSSQTQAELERLAPSSVFVCGGPAAVSDGACAQIAAVCGVEPRRIYGDNAVATAAQIDLVAPTATGGAWSGEAFLCTSDGYWDALAAAPVAYALHMPIFLTEADGTLSDATLAAIRECGITKVHIAGGPAAVSTSAESMLGDLMGQRFAGELAVHTSEAIASFGLSRGMAADNMGVATTSGYWDALAGAALCGKKNSVLVLVGDAGSHSIDGFVADHSSGEISAYVFGGSAAVSDDVVARLQSVTAGY